MLQCSQPSPMPAGPTSKMDFPQQRGWLVRTLKLSRRFPLSPPVVAAGASSRTMKIETLPVDFTDEQKRYLEGFTTGLQISRIGRGLAGAGAAKASAEPSGPDAAHFKAQDKVLASGKKLADQERFKREEHPLDAYPRLKPQAAGHRGTCAR